MGERILVVDDEKRIRLILKQLLLEEGYSVALAESGEECLVEAREFQPDLILLDLKMPGMGGREALRELNRTGFGGLVVILTAYGTIPGAVEAMREGAYDYITKPFENDDLLLAIRRGLNHMQTRRELENAREQLRGKYSIDGIVTHDPSMQRQLEVLRRAAATDTPILITGESGTGKELFARAIHQNSPRRDKPFLALNCGALPESLIESELFGYLRGAFSGAVGAKAGLVQQAHSGSLFLDEIGEMGLEAQVKLLRFVQSGEFIPVGGTKTLAVSVRLIAASNRDLRSAADAGAFRADLFYRLNVVNIAIPPLRRRRNDIPLLAEFFTRKHAPAFGKEGARVSPQAMRALMRYDWPGNVRELENTLRSAFILSDGPIIGVEDLPSHLAEVGLPIESEVEAPSLHDVVTAYQEGVERQKITEALRESGGNKAKAARILGIGRNTILRKIKKLGIE